MSGGIKACVYLLADNPNDMRNTHLPVAQVTSGMCGETVLQTSPPFAIQKGKDVQFNMHANIMALNKWLLKKQSPTNEKSPIIFKNAFLNVNVNPLLN